MSNLQVYVNEHLGSPAEDEAVACPWVLRDARGAISRAGESALTEMPAADRCELVAPASRVLLTQITLPTGNRQKLRRLLPFAIEDRVMTEPEKIHAIAGPRQADGQTAVAVVDKAWLAAVLAQFRNARLKPQAMWVETLLPVLTPESWIVIWKGGGKDSGKGGEGFLRSGVASGVFLDGGVDGEPPIGLLLALQEARAATAANAAPAQLIVRPARGAVLPDIQQWADALRIDVLTGERWDWFERIDRLGPNDGINLMQDDFAPRSAARDWLPRLRPALVLLGLIMAVQIVGAGVDWFSLNRQRNTLQATIEQRFRGAFPDARVVVDAPLQMRRNLEELRRGAGQVEPNDFLPLLARATRLIEASANHRLSALNYDAGELKIDILLPDAESAEELKNALQAPDLVVKLEAINPKPGGVEARFTLSSGASS
ncbi:MAG: type II secretion system protein GspL [Burkholderiales bacterium]|nr:type II secretion system protein GspL [Burkholderiales bacterium]